MDSTDRLRGDGAAGGRARLDPAAAASGAKSRQPEIDRATDDRSQGGDGRHPAGAVRRRIRSAIPAERGLRHVAYPRIRRSIIRRRRNIIHPVMQWARGSPSPAAFIDRRLWGWANAGWRNGTINVNDPLYQHQRRPRGFQGGAWRAAGGIGPASGVSGVAGAGGSAGQGVLAVWWRGGIGRPAVQEGGRRVASAARAVSVAGGIGGGRRAPGRSEWLPSNAIGRGDVRVPGSASAGRRRGGGQGRAGVGNHGRMPRRRPARQRIADSWAVRHRAVFGGSATARVPISSALAARKAGLQQRGGGFQTAAAAAVEAGGGAVPGSRRWWRSRGGGSGGRGGGAACWENQMPASTCAPN